MLVDEAGGRCQVCGYQRYIGNLQFHHVDRSTKSFSLGSGQGKSLGAFREEAKKCVLLCANCHGEVESGLIPCPPLDRLRRIGPYPQSDSNRRSPA